MQGDAEAWNPHLSWINRRRRVNAMKVAKLLYIVMILSLLYVAVPIETASAGMFDRIKDIYQAPDKLDELQEAYDASIKAVEGQLEDSRRQAEQLLQRQQELESSNEAIREQNEQMQARNEELARENARLVGQMEELEQNRQSLYRKAAIAAGALVALIAVYALSVRVWRFLTWRRQGRGGRAHDDSRGVTLP